MYNKHATGITIVDPAELKVNDGKMSVDADLGPYLRVSALSS